MRQISVIIPAYNHARYLAEAIESALAQTVAPAEVLVVDDGSTDKTSQVLERYVDRVSVIRQLNGGVSRARNEGVRRATGDLLAFLDADDVWLPEKLEQQARCLEAEPEVALVHCGVQEIDAEGRVLREKLNGMDGHIADEMLLFRRPTILGGGSGVMLRQSSFHQVGGFDERLSTSADWDLYYRIASRSRVGFIARPLLQYRLHGANMHSNIRAMEGDMLLAYGKAFGGGAALPRNLRRQAYGSLHRVLAGSYFAAGNRRDCLRHAVKAVSINPGTIHYFLGSLLRRLWRSRG